MIPDEAVEAAAQAEYEHEMLALEGCWCDASPEARALFRQSARKALEAAAPFLRAQALGDAADRLEKSAESVVLSWGDAGMSLIATTTVNAIRHDARMLRARAVTERGGE